MHKSDECYYRVEQHTNTLVELLRKKERKPNEPNKVKIGIVRLKYFEIQLFSIIIFPLQIEE